MQQSARIPRSCTVLVVGGGPGGSYTAAALAREGIETVLLEADIFPRYHIGESMLPAMRQMLRFIDVDSTFDRYGFTIKNGAAFKLSQQNKEGYTDFIAAGGPGNYSWNILRSDADNILFRHAETSGAKVFDGVKVTEIFFEADGSSSIGKPVRASFVCKSDGSTGDITFDYVVDASGRAGIISTKYLKNREFSQSLKNIATWGYWKGTGAYGVGTSRENAPFAEALIDESGWAWFIPLHIGVTSVGIVLNQERANKKKASQDASVSAHDFYLEQLKLAPNICSLMGSATLKNIPDNGQLIRTASDYSYSSNIYAAPRFRIVGDAGAFIDPFFSSGVHLALSGGLSAALTICASLRGDCTEAEASQWHSDKVASSYTYFKIVVLGAYKQMRLQSEPVLAEIDEDNFDRAFSFIRPVIQGSIDVDDHLTFSDLSKTIDICSRAFEPAQTESREAVLKKIASDTENNSHPTNISDNLDEKLTNDEKRVLSYINARKAIGTKDRALTITSFLNDSIQGRRPRLELGKLGLELSRDGTD